ncbi:hypothetical protein [Paenibacillus sp. P22]|uniref:hypothetical protein n=1 Tax=Paenibacillus sp. P22 TaxID=483908 RepID=UPI0004315E2B|nr:hypothetical protein [Paenibacillus sp. P22]CDN44544.1 hypothetical protein BN871_EZ_00100 [Paenibacillus sp. P22]
MKGKPDDPTETKVYLRMKKRITVPPGSTVRLGAVARLLAEPWLRSGIESPFRYL